MTNNPMRLIDSDVNNCLIKVISSLMDHFKLLFFNLSVSAICFLLMIGCSTTQSPVPVVDRSKVDAAGSINKSVESVSSYNQFYIVQKGDTLYSIALNHGIDFKKLAEWNNITDPKNIKPGQRISLFVPASDSQPTLFALPQQPIETTLPNEQPFATIPHGIDEGSRVKADLKTSPKAIKLPFSEQNVARLKDPANSPSAVQMQLTSPSLERNTRIELAPQPESQQFVAANQSDTQWMWPTTGKLLSPFSKNSKGVKISGQAGQPILASAAGEVVYSGHGLRGYGNLIIIKHNNTFLSAYAHNSKILVKEGEAVVRGQKIAEMGSTDTDTIQLHFEIRKHGKPVDPLEYLPNPS